MKIEATITSAIGGLGKRGSLRRVYFPCPPTTNYDNEYSVRHASGQGARACGPRIFGDRIARVMLHKVTPPNPSARDRLRSEGYRISDAAEFTKQNVKGDIAGLSTSFVITGPEHKR